ncbi:MAG: helix-turn-helix domain-containing protein [Galactobacter sp.]
MATRTSRSRTPTQSFPVGASWRREARTYVMESVETPARVEEPFSIIAEEDTSEVPVEFMPHTHQLHELVWVRGGTMTTRVENQIHTVPPGQGLWIPAGMEHSGRMTANTRLFDALFDPVRSPVTFPEPTGVLMSPVLESLLTHLVDPGLGREQRLRAEAVVFDVLAPSARHISLEIPSTSLLEPIVTALLERPGDQRAASDWAKELGTSERTIARAFRAATGLSMVQWRQALRVHEALALMAEGLQVQAVSQHLRFAQPSTFIFSFKRVVGVTPGAYLAAD